MTNLHLLYLVILIAVAMICATVSDTHHAAELQKQLDHCQFQITGE